MPLTHHSTSNLCKCFYSIVKNDKLCRLKISIGCGMFGSGCYGLRFRFGNPRLIVIANEVKPPSLRMNAVSEAISKGIPTHSIRDCFALSEKGLAITLIASGYALATTHSNEGEAVPASPPSASLTQITSNPSLFEKERGDTKIVLFNYSPSLTLLERGK